MYLLFSIVNKICDIILDFFCKFDIKCCCIDFNFIGFLKEGVVK